MAESAYELVDKKAHEHGHIETAAALLRTLVMFT
jgi:hypothetical protein